MYISICIISTLNPKSHLTKLKGFVMAMVMIHLLYQCDKSIYNWLTVWNMTFIFPYILLIIIPIDVHIFQRGRYTTNQMRSTMIRSHGNIGHHLVDYQTDEWWWYSHLFPFGILMFDGLTMLKYGMLKTSWITTERLSVFPLAFTGRSQGHNLQGSLNSHWKSSSPLRDEPWGWYTWFR